MSYELSELDRMVAGLIEPGCVAAVQMKPPRVKIEADGWVSDWLPWFAFAAGKARYWRPPSVGEQAILLNPSGDPAQGFALVGFYTTNYAGDGREDIVGWLMPDGAVMEYDHAQHSLLVAGIQSATVQASTQVIVDCPETAFTGNVTIQGKLTVVGDALFKAKATVTALFSYLSGLAGFGGSGGGSVIQGSLQQAGGQLSSNGVVLDSHTHQEQGDGQPTSPPIK
ncbi:phage baseplate assembly protein V [Chitinimonas sp. PSY-7]|uniref:phage baseplate assembly protein V n=1 Tax=Chitinimonas sp. PSY-7 TaxID=3459088 RepID=UPI00404019BF